MNLPFSPCLVCATRLSSMELRRIHAPTKRWFDFCVLVIRSEDSLVDAFWSHMIRCALNPCGCLRSFCHYVQMTTGILHSARIRPAENFSHQIIA